MKRWQTRLTIPTILALIVLLLPLAAAPAAPTAVAYDMVGSSSLNLISHTNPFEGAFGSAGDGFQKYQRFVSSSIPFAVLDDSLSIFTADTLGIIKEGNTEVFFGVVDTVNSDNSGPVSATWLFDISSATGLSMSVDMGAMGDFESSDTFTWQYSIDGGTTHTAFASTVDETGSHTYTLEGGASFTLNDPMLIGGSILTDDLATFTTPIIGSGSQLTVTLTADTNGGSEAFAFQNLIIKAGGTPLIAVGGATPPATAQGGTSLLTVAVTPATDPASTGIAVSADLSAVGGSATQAFFDDGTNGDVTSGDNVFSFEVTVDPGTAPGAYSMPASASDAEGRTSNTTIELQVIGFLTIMEIQGDGQFSPVVGDIVETSGVITAFNFNGRDMWIEDRSGDGDPLTSDGIFVDDANRLPGVEIGDLVVIRGQVEEQQFGNALPRTRIDDTELVEIVSSGNALPAPVLLTDLPDVSMTEGEAFWEPLEGMLVRVEDAVVTSSTNGFWEFGMLTSADAEPGSGYLPQAKRIFVRDLGNGVIDYNPERIMTDDAINRIVVSAGDEVNYLVGIVDYTFSNYKLQTTAWDIDTHDLPKSPVSKRSGRGDLSVTTFNVENLFDLINNPDKADGGSTPDPEELETQLAKLALAIEVELQLPEIIVTQEAENEEILQDLGDLVNASTGTSYVAVGFETSDVRGIEAGFLYDEDRVTLLDAFQMTGANVEAAFGPSSASPGREPIVGLFEVDGTELIVIGNHFKSKGGDDPLYGVVQPPVRVTEVQRKMQAQVVRDFVDNILAEDPGALLIVAGDLNDFEFAEPGEGIAHPVGILEGRPGSIPLTNLIYEEQDKDRYSFVFDGNSQILDYILVSPALVPAVQGADFLHFNAGVPAVAFEDDPTTALGASDHDPLEARFNLRRATPALRAPGEFRFATFNASLNRFGEGDLAAELSAPGSAQPSVIAEIIQRNRPEVLLINEFDFDEAGIAAQGFLDNYLKVSQNGAAPIDYPYSFVAPSNTGIFSGFDLDNSGAAGDFVPNDSFGFGFFPGQFGMVVYSMFPIDEANIRTFQNFLWKDMPGALLPDDPAVPGPADWYSSDELDVFRLSSKSHWDVPIQINGETVHFLVSHPTPPVFDGAEDRNGTRNHDEIRFWADYITGGATASYIYDDDGAFGGLGEGELFVIAGDQNSDPFDGDSIPGSAQQLLDHALVNTELTPSSLGGPEQSELQGLANDTHIGDPAFDTADFNPFNPGNLRVDYVLPRVDMAINDGGVFWPEMSDPLFGLAGTFPFPSSDHRLVWIVVELG